MTGLLVAWLIAAPVPCEQGCANAQRLCQEKCSDERCPQRCLARAQECQDVCTVKRRAEEAKIKKAMEKDSARRPQSLPGAPRPSGKKKGH
ncbi:MAG: hypothetical protein K1X89_29610 [Myxococcaceae bacterium]|nr:hypothetical protein [Myxococcaceae bacterium]